MKGCLRSAQVIMFRPKAPGFSAGRQGAGGSGIAELPFSSFDPAASNPDRSLRFHESPNIFLPATGISAVSTSPDMDSVM
jgi:hypothetical protein